MVGAAAEASPLPPPPTDGVVCPCMGTTVATSTRRGTRATSELELLKRSSQACLGTVPGRRVPAPRPLVDRRPDRRGRRSRSPPAPRRARSRSAEAAADTYDRRVPADARCTTSTSRSAHGWTGSAAGGGRGTTATRRRVLGRPRGRLARRRVSTLGKLVVSRPGRGRGPRAALPVPRRATSSPAARATRCCSTSAATSWTTG